MSEIPKVVRYEVYERYHDGTLNNVARGSSAWEQGARNLASMFTAEAQERYEAESRGPVKPDPPSTFVVVRVTETREIL